VPPRPVSPEPVRIARLITRLNVGGPAIQAIDLSTRLEALGYHTLLVHGSLGAGEADMRYRIPAGPRFEIAHVPSMRRQVAPLSDAAALARLVALLRRFRPAIVHTHMAKAGTLGRIATIAYNRTRPRGERARCVHTYHGHVLEGYFAAPAVAAFSAVERLLARRTDAIVAVSDAVRRDLLDSHHIGAPDQYRVIRLGFDLSAFAAITCDDRSAARRALDLEADARVVAFVGRLTAIKQPGVFVDVAARVAAADPRARFLVAGGGELEAEMKARAAAAGVAGRMRFAGWQRDLAGVYAASDVVAITSANEGTPVALIEGMAAAVPGVAFAVGGVPDVVSSAGAGVLVEPGDVASFSDAVMRLLADEAERRAMGDRARRLVVARYGIDRLVTEIDSLYRQLR
jgi:glycosyltransferase involved in cell wall biosynthesis